MMQNPQYYFGIPGDLIALPRPTRGMQVATKQGRVPHDLIGGGVAVTTRTRLRRSWVLEFPWLDESTAQAVTDYVQGVYGPGPFRLIDPMFRNLLPLNASVAGRVSGDPKTGRLAQWLPGGGDTLTLEPTTVAPPERPSGVMRWSGIAAGDTLVLGGRDAATSTGLPIFDETMETPVVPGENLTFSFYAKAASGSGQLLARLVGYSAAGAALTTANGGSVTLTGAWQRISLMVNQAALGGAVYARPVIYANASTALIAQMAAAQLSYASTVEPFLTGWGVPRVLIVEEPDHVLEMLANRSLKLTVREV